MSDHLLVDRPHLAHRSVPYVMARVARMGTGLDWLRTFDRLLVDRPHLAHRSVPYVMARVARMGTGLNPRPFK